jgi:hypothetical protein
MERSGRRDTARRVPERTRRENAKKKHEPMIGLVVKVAGFGVGYCYPTYSALKLLDRKAISPDDATLWLTYFMVAFSLMVSETWGVANWCVSFASRCVCLEVDGGETTERRSLARALSLARAR